MSMTLTGMRARVRQTLADGGALIWQDTALDEGIRRALEDLSRVYGASLTLAGLDGALITTLPERDGGILCGGAAGYAAHGRAVSRVEMNPEGGMAAAAMNRWAEEQLRRFGEALEQIRRQLLQSSAEAPYAAWAFPLPGSYTGGEDECTS